MVRVAVGMVIASLACGMLIGLLLYAAPDTALARTLANTFVRGGIGVFLAPGGALLALGTGLVWGLCLIMVAAFPYTAWLIYRATSAHREFEMKQKMDAYSRAIGGKPKD
jgi:hypothetical protein